MNTMHPMHHWGEACLERKVGGPLERATVCSTNHVTTEIVIQFDINNWSGVITKRESLTCTSQINDALGSGEAELGAIVCDNNAHHLPFPRPRPLLAAYLIVAHGVLQASG